MRTVLADSRVAVELKQLWRRFLEEEEGQAATEYVLVISVMVIAMIAAASPFTDPDGPFQSAMKELSRNIGSLVATQDNELLLPVR